MPEIFKIKSIFDGPKVQNAFKSPIKRLSRVILGIGCGSIGSESASALKSSSSLNQILIPCRHESRNISPQIFMCATETEIEMYGSNP